jgi:hypothetical protein
VGGLTESEALAHLRANKALEVREVVALRRKLAQLSELLAYHERRLAEVDHGIAILES